MLRADQQCVCIKIDTKNDLLYSVQSKPCVTDDDKRFDDDHPLTSITQYTIYVTDLRSMETKLAFGPSYDEAQFNLDPAEVLDLDEEELMDFKAITDICIAPNRDGRKLYILQPDSLFSIIVEDPENHEHLMEVIDFDNECIKDGGNRHWMRRIEVDRFERFALLLSSAAITSVAAGHYEYHHTTLLRRINIANRRVQDTVVLQGVESVTPDSLTIKPTSSRNDPMTVFVCCRRGVFEIEFGLDYQQSVKRVIAADQLDAVRKDHQLDISMLCDKLGNVWSCWKATGIQVVYPRQRPVRADVINGGNQWDTISSIAIDRRGSLYAVEDSGTTRRPDQIYIVGLEDDIQPPVPVLWKRVYDICRLSRFLSACKQQSRKRAVLRAVIDVMASVDGKLSATERSIVIEFGSDKQTLGMPLRLREKTKASSSSPPSKRRRIEK